MSANKDQLARCRIIDECLIAKKKCTKKDFMDAFVANEIHVTPRTLTDDIKLMRSDPPVGYGAKLPYTKQGMYYSYEDPDYSIKGSKLNNGEKLAVGVASKLVKGLKGTKLERDYKVAVKKMSKSTARPATGVTEDEEMLFELEPEPYNKGIEHVDTIVEAAETKKALCVGYKKFGSEKTDEHIFHPYFYKRFKGRFYILGHSDTRRRTTTFALDRMEYITPARVPFRPNVALKYKEYYEHTIGVTLGQGPPQTITLWFSPSQAYYLNTLHLHHTQETVSEDNTGLVIKIKLIPNPELEEIIMGYGPKCKVIGPKALRKSIKEKAMQTVALYANDDDD